MRRGIFLGKRGSKANCLWCSGVVYQIRATLVGVGCCTVHEQQLVHLLKYAALIAYYHQRLVLEESVPTQNLLENPRANVWVQRTQGVVQEIDG